MLHTSLSHPEGTLRKAWQMAETLAHLIVNSTSTEKNRGSFSLLQIEEDKEDNTNHYLIRSEPYAMTLLSNDHDQT